MLIAIMSDSHDNIWNMRLALQIITQRDAKAIIHCGDFIAPFMLKEMDSAQIPVHGVFGNNDGDQHLLTRLSLTSLSHIILHGMVGELDANGFKIGFTHERIKADGLLYSCKYDMVCFGHTHVGLRENHGRIILLNPGEVMGKEGSPGFCFFDTNSGEVEQVYL